MVEYKLKPYLGTNTILIVENKEHWFKLKDLIRVEGFFTEKIYDKYHFNKYCFNLKSKYCNSLNYYENDNEYKNFVYITSNSLFSRTYELW